MTLVDDWESVRGRLDRASLLLLDFDGPICSVFAGLSAVSVAQQLRKLLSRNLGYELPENVLRACDPFDVLRYASTVEPDLADNIESALTSLECEAVETATPTPGAHELIHRWSDSKKLVVIVSNNSATAIEKYCEINRLRHVIQEVSARESSDPRLLKPSPHLLRRALLLTEKSPSDAIFIGDSKSDAVAGRTAGITTIGFANRYSKISTLRTVADYVVTHLP